MHLGSKLDMKWDIHFSSPEKKTPWIAEKQLSASRNSSIFIDS
jgi:hypothetical protein